MLGDYFGHKRGAEATLAPAHAGPQALFDAVDRRHAERGVERVDYLALAYLLAAADRYQYIHPADQIVMFMQRIYDKRRKTLQAPVGARAELHSDPGADDKPTDGTAIRTMAYAVLRRLRPDGHR